jgi:stress-induced morphogen
MFFASCPAANRATRDLAKFNKRTRNIVSQQVTLKAISAKFGPHGRASGLDSSAGPKEETDWMPMDARDIESMIKAAIPDAEVTIRDLAGDGDHYAATVISESFRGKSRVQQHQIVYQSLRGQMGGVLHALALQTGVPEG